MSRILFFAFFVCTFSFRGDASNASALEIEDAYIRGIPPGQKVTAAYLRIKNNTSVSCNLVAATSDLAERVEFHRHYHSNGVMRMRRVESLVVPPGEVLEFRSGGLHLMIFLAKSGPSDWTESKISFHFSDCDNVEHVFQVQDKSRKFIVRGKS